MPSRAVYLPLICFVFFLFISFSRYVAQYFVHELGARIIFDQNMVFLLFSLIVVCCGMVMWVFYSLLLTHKYDYNQNNTHAMLAFDAHRMRVCGAMIWVEKISNKTTHSLTSKQYINNRIEFVDTYFILICQQKACELICGHITPST